MAKIPPHATRVFKGEIFDIYQWPQELYDGSVATFEMAKRPTTVVVIPLGVRGEIYYSKQEQPGKEPFLGLFGGRSEEGEEPLAAAQRELLEEAGLVSENWSTLFVHETPGKLNWTIHYFLAKHCQKVREPNLDAGERIEVFSATLDDFVENIITDPAFVEHELRSRVISAFNPEAADSLKAALV